MEEKKFEDTANQVMEWIIEQNRYENTRVEANFVNEKTKTAIVLLCEQKNSGRNFNDHQPDQFTYTMWLIEDKGKISFMGQIDAGIKTS